MPFGWITAQARKGNVAASAGGELRSRSQPLRLTLNLGSSVSAGGTVEAEGGDGAPSVGTRVVLTVTSNLLPAPQRLETLTGSGGAYSFTGIPVGGTTLSLLFYGPDDTTIGASRVVTVPDGATGTVAIPPVRLDATPPRVLSIDPPSNSTNVSPSSQIAVTFSEPIAAGFLTTQWFQLLATDTNSLVPVAIEGSVRPDGTYIVRLTPPAPPAGQRFPLKSNVLYRFTIPNGVQDTTGNPMKVPVGASFTTVNYTEPEIVRIEPAVDLALFEGATFRVKFNKAVNAQSGFAIFERLDRHHGNPVEEIPVTRSLDPADPSTMLVAPTGVAIAESSFYRLRVSGVQDTQTPPNAMREQRVYDYFSFDTKKPVVTIVSPAEKLVSGVLYSVTANVTEDGGAEASDVAYVDWLDAGGVAIGRSTTKPFAYQFAAPATSTPSSFTLKASATDLSNNSSAAPASHTWEVIPNQAPRDIVVTHAPAAVYPGGAVETRVRFTDEGVTATVVLEIRGTKIDGSELRETIASQNPARPSTAVEFPEVLFRWTAPAALKDGTASVVASVVDAVNQTGSAAAPLTILADTAPPVVVSLLPRPESRYRYGVANQYTIELNVRDDETSVARALFTVSGTTVLDATSGTYDAATRVTTFRATVSVQPKKVDTRIPIVVTAWDARGNQRRESFDVIYERVEDAEIPDAAWLTPLDGAALPSNQTGWLTTLRIRATDNQRVTSVKFESTALAAPIEVTAPKSGTSDIFEAKAALTMPADGSSFVIKAFVADGDPDHTIELPITVDPVAAAPVITTDINISSISADQYANKSVLVRGARVYITVPLTLKDLILVDGATLSVSEETKLDVTIADRLFVDGDSRIDVSGKGWLGGLVTREDNSFTNPSRSGRTINGTLGATNASASHAGIGGAYLGATNATYGSIADPSDFGAGGAANPNGSERGGNGGGAIRIAGGSGLARLVVAGRIAADGVVGAWTGGAGGSIDLRARALITSPATRITANGADDDAHTTVDMGGGGGRIALRVTDRFEVLSSQIAARGGRNGSGADGAQYVDGGAGTVYLATPDGTRSLIVSSSDERYPASTHRTMGTPIGAVDAEAIVIGPRALARFDVAPAVTPAVDATAMVVQPGDIPSITLRSTTPASGGSVAQNTKIDALFDAASGSGIREVRAILNVQPSDAVTHPGFAAAMTNSTISANVPSDAPAGSASLKLLVRDRAGRTAETPATPFTIVANAAPSITQFDVTPPGEIYAGRTIQVAAAASDDVAVSSITLAPSIGTLESDAAVKPAPSTMTRAFRVHLPPSATPGSSVALTLSAIDDFPGRIPTTQTKSVTILNDALPPSVTVLKPAPNAEVQEGSGATFAVEVNASDAEVAVKRVAVTFEGTETPLTLSNGLYRATLNVPSVDGTDPVAKTLTVKAYDYQDNAATSTLTIFVKPLIDPNAPALSWVCGSPGAMAPAGLAIPLRVSAVPSSGANGVQSVTIAVGNNAPVTATSAGTNLYQITHTIPAGTADGTTFDIRVTARSVAGNESTLLGTLTAVTGTTINTASTINATDTAFENQSLIVTSGGTLTIVGPHTFRNLVVLGGGTLVQKHGSVETADRITVARLFVACDAIINVSRLGHPASLTSTGAAASDYQSGGSHIGRGAIWDRLSGGVFGSIYEPAQPGGGGNIPGTPPTSFDGQGGGMVRIHASGSIAIDGIVRADGTWSSYGAGAAGSVWLSTPGAFHGAGTITADGSPGSFGGGGGAIAIELGTRGGTFAEKMSAIGGAPSSGRNGAAGTLLLRAAGASGELVVDNKGLAQYSATELPSFGIAVVTAVPTSGTVTLDRRFVMPSLAGNRVRVVAADGSVRGT
ncbi:MAG TPA: Ig-like domain-containing protein, partial [Thermoanaerobaculia bacterium]|nr:Ig-like domain-containing protein [Thermoanaerobaculia bacterium]